MSLGAPACVRCHIRVRGVVQGVGFRPFVFAAARELGLVGHVGNDDQGVVIEAEGPPAAVDALLDRLRADPPVLAVVEQVEHRRIPPVGEQGFTVVESRTERAATTLVAPDTATCEDCLAELFDPADRRYRYAFVNCTNCGPRFTIVTAIPYDRPNTTMAGFPMCADCAREYHDPADRRFHAQPTCCPDCGPRLLLSDRDGRAVGGDPVERTAELLAAGAVVAVKGLGGYHLAARADEESAVAALRSRKHREDKPFALMCPDLASARELCELGPAEESALAGRRRPIVLLTRSGRAAGAVAPSVAPRSRHLGVMLPYTPLHHLLLAALGRPVVLTSGNVSDEPIAYLDDEARTRLAPVADALLSSDRPIHMRTDDSVVRVVGGAELALRRSRGYVPEPVNLARPAPRPVLGCGAELKSTFCLLRGRHAFLSHHIGDLENAETLHSFTTGMEHFRRLLQVDPEVVAYDLHPEYLSSKYALALEGVELVGVQHHHAHVASCLADNEHDGPVIGVAFDGTGYGSDATLWGGELLVADLAGFERVGHLAPMRLPGGAAAVREPWRMAAAYLAALGDDGADLAVRARNAERWRQVVALARSGTAAPVTTSAGRLFDAVAALAGVRDKVNYEGQAAIELEALVDGGTAGGYEAGVTSGPPVVVHGEDLVRAAVADVRDGAPAATVATRFHRGLAAGVLEAVGCVQEHSGLTTVALSGGVFQNVVLLELVAAGLAARGLRVLTHRRVPPNDAGISLGQAVVAATRQRA